MDDHTVRGPRRPGPGLRAGRDLTRRAEWRVHPSCARLALRYAYCDKEAARGHWALSVTPLDWPQTRP